MSDPSDGHIAIIGLSCRFPGARNPEEFWRNLADGVDAITRFPPRRLPDSGSAGEEYVPAAGFVTDPEWLDAGYFGYSPRDARLIDPQQRVFLECAVEALEDAGCDPDRYPGLIGVYAGCTDTGYASILRSRLAELPGVTNWEIRIATGTDFLSTRVAYKLGLRGPAIAVNAACATSLVAVHIAMQALLAGDCDVALAGGARVRFPATPGEYTEGGIISPDGTCRAFDASARGIVGGDGAGLAVLKRLPDALEDGDRIRAVIRGSAVNNDGANRMGYTAPSVDGQADVIRTAHLVADVHPGTITYVEAHGTATPIGDPIEVAALTKAFGQTSRPPGFCALGSVKTNIGHTDAAAGIAGLIKTVKALENGVIPPNLHFTAPNPQIDFATGPFRIETSPRTWAGGEVPRRAGVSSFGMGGTNAHIVLEEAPAQPITPHRPWQILLLSAATPTALEAATTRLADHLRTRPGLGLASVAWTLQTGRRQLPYRRFALVNGMEDAVSVLTAGPGPRLVTSEGPARSRTLPAQAPAFHADERSMLSAAGRLWLTGVPIDWAAAHGEGRPLKAALPTYPFERRRYVVEPLEPGGGALLAPDTGVAARDGTSDVPRVIAEMFGEMLGLGHGDFDPDESFFDLGGDSLIATQFLVRIRKTYQVEVALRSMLGAPTAETFAALVQERLREQAEIEHGAFR